MRDGFVFYRSFKEALEDLEDGDYRVLVDALINYALDGVEPNLSGTIRGMFKLMKPQIDANNKRYENGKKGAEHGAKGGRPKKVTAPEPLNNPVAVTEKPLNNPNETPKEKDKEKDKEKEKDKDCATPLQVGEEVLYPKYERSIYAPQLIDVQEFCAGKGLMINPDAFFHHYESTGWKIAGQPIYDWKSLAKSWDSEERRKRQIKRPMQSGTGSKVQDALREILNGDT